MLSCKSYIYILLVGLLFFTGCSKEDRYHFDMELDGNLSYIYPYDMNESESGTRVGKSILSRLLYEYKYYSTDEIVDNNIYNFLFVLPIKTKTDLAILFSHKLIQQDIDLFVYYYAYKKAWSTSLWFTNLSVQQNQDGYYRYKLYGVSNQLASKYYLNDIKDGTIKVDIYDDNSEMVNRETLEITSNEINISAKEVENVLDSLGISHERLSFQPEDF